MTINFIDGFDLYTPALNGSSPSLGSWANNATYLTNLMIGRWVPTVQTGGTFQFVAPLSATGAALKIAGTGAGSFTGIVHTYAAAQATVIGGFAFQVGSASVAQNFVHFFSGATQQASIRMTTAGLIVVDGGTDGTPIVSSTSPALVANTTHYLEWSITSGASGAVQVWLDGVSILSGTGNTNTAASGTFSSIRLGTATGTTTIFDNLYFDDGSGSPLLTNPIIETHAAASDNSVAFTATAGVMGAAYLLDGVTTNAPGAGELFLRKFTAPTGGATLASVSCVPGATSAGANFKAVLYSDNAGTVNALLATGTQVTGTTSGSVFTAPFASPPVLTSNTAYWIGYITDTSVVLNLSDASTTGGKVANTYASGAPASPVLTGGQSNWALWGNLTGLANNTAVVSQSPPPGALADVNFTSSSVSGAEDLFNSTALSSTPALIHAVAVSGYLKDQAVGARTVSLQMKSGSTDSNGSLAAFTPATTYAWAQSMFLTDPNTSTAWTIAGLNAAKQGYKIVT